MSQDEVGFAPKSDRRYYTKDEKLQAVELTEKIGTHAAAKELGIADGNLSRWQTGRRQMPEPLRRLFRYLNSLPRDEALAVLQKMKSYEARPKR